MGKQRIDTSMNSLILDRESILDYAGNDRYVPAPLVQLLLWESSYRCSVCSEALCELHHIRHVKDGGETSYENLIVLCPNCHTRVHLHESPTSKQLLDIKRYHAVDHSWPTAANISDTEKEFLRAALDEEPRSRQSHAEVNPCTVSGDGPSAAIKEALKNSPFAELTRSGVVHLSVVHVVGLATEPKTTNVSLAVRLTSWGARWLAAVEGDDEHGRAFL